MSITKVSDFSKDSFIFEDVTNQGSRFNRIRILTQDRGSLLLKVENCFSCGVIADDRFGKIKYSVPIILEDRESFLSLLELVEAEAFKQVSDPPEYGRSERLMRCLYRKDWHPVLYTKIDGDTRMYPPVGDVGWYLVRLFLFRSSVVGIWLVWVVRTRVALVLSSIVFVRGRT